MLKVKLLRAIQRLLEDRPAKPSRLPIGAMVLNGPLFGFGTLPTSTPEEAARFQHALDMFDKEDGVEV